MFPHFSRHSAGRGPNPSQVQSKSGPAAYMFPSMKNQIFATGSQFTQANHCRSPQPPQMWPQVQSSLPDQFNSCKIYDHQMERFLNEQQMLMQEQAEQRVAIQRKIEQQRKDQVELAKVQNRLGNEACKVDNFPFGNIAGTHQPKRHGVVKITNLPYAVTRYEIHQLIGRHAGIVSPEHGGGIHIIMERSTAKTMDAFVEFKSQKDAEATVRRLSFTESGRYPRLGTRHVDISLSSQDELLHDLFPRAKCIKWQDGIPQLLPNDDPYSAGFQGFLTSEEIRGLLSHAHNPSRSPFTERCRQRTYECLISTLWKFPWFATSMYTVADRDELYQAAIQQVLELCEKVKQRRIIGLNESLLVDLLRAGCKCPAFNERQKFCLIAAAEMPAFCDISHPQYFEYWPFDCLAKTKLTNEYDVMYYAQVTRKALEICDQDNLLIPNNWRNRVGLATESPWGHLWIEWNFHAKTTTFDEAAKLELQLVCTLIQSTLNVGFQSANQAITGPLVLSSSGPTQRTTGHPPGLCSDPWTKDMKDFSKSNDSKHETSSSHGSDVKYISRVNPLDNGLPLGLSGRHLRSDSGSTISGAVSHFGSTNGSLATNEGDVFGIFLDNKSKAQGNFRSRHQHSHSFSAAVPFLAQLDLKGPSATRRRGSISIPPTIQSVGGYTEDRDDRQPSNHANKFSSHAGDEQDGKSTGDYLNISSLMLQHGIWVDAPAKGDVFSMDGGGKC